MRLRADLQAPVGVQRRRVLDRRARPEPVDRVEARAADALGNLARRAVDRVGRERRQRLAGADWTVAPTLTPIGKP